MKRVNLIYALISSLATFGAIYYALDVIKCTNPNLWLSSLFILVLAWLAVLTCPLVRNSQAYKKAFK